MKKHIRTLLVLSVFTFTFNLTALEDIKVFQGQMAQPEFNLLGDLICVYKNSEKKISLDTLKFKEAGSYTKTVSLGERAFSPIIKKNRQGQIWIVWAEMENGQSHILFGQLDGSHIVSSQIVSDREGYNFSPDLSFDWNDQPWIVWINYENSQSRVLVKEIISQNVWEVNSSLLSSALTPQIIVDHNSHIWVFWNGINIGNDEIFYSVFNRFNWSPLCRVNHENSFPQLSPKVTLDQKGLIWLVWSGYDGQDYEIYSRFWDGKKWVEEINVTNNSQKNDVFPSVAVVSNDIPIVVWAQSEKDESNIFIKFLENDSWSKEIKISSNRGRNVFPKMAVEGDKIGIIWQCHNEINSRIFTFDYLRTLNKKGESIAAGKGRAKKQYNVLLDENKYIGYGDSITFGYINFKPVPEKGYLPRLKVMLDQNFGETTVVNEGEPGEITLDGLSRIEGILEEHLARFLLLMEGTNDIIFKNISMETTFFNLKEMVKKCLKIGVVPMIATIIPRDDWRWNNEFYRDRIYDLNQKIRDLAEEFSIPFIEQFYLFYFYPIQEGGWRSLLSDYNHPNEKGYQIMAEGWFGNIKNFPFPPINVQVERKDRGDIFILPTLNLQPIDPHYPDSYFNRPKMNIITWLDNSKIFDKSTVKGYRIYRKKEEESDDKFQLINEIYEKFEYHDKEIIFSEHYIYRVSTLRKDGVEGPCSESKKDY